MSGLDVSISVEDEFSRSLERFNELYDQCAQNLSHYERLSDISDRRTKDLCESAEKASVGIGGAGLGGAFLMLNQALQFFDTIAGKVSASLDDIGDKQRSFIIFGKEAGAEFNDFAKSVANSMGRAESEVRKAGQRFGRLGVGGKNIKELTELADRFSNLNPGREFSDISETLADAIKSRSSSSLADLLGGGEYVEQKLERKHIDRYLKKGDVSGAIEQFKAVADEMGYTQEKADEFGMTIDRKVQRVTEKIKNYVTDIISDVVSVFEPYIDKFIEWLNRDDVQGFFDDFKKNAVLAGAAVGALVETVVSGWSMLTDLMSPVADSINEITKEYFPYLKEESLSLVDMLTGIFVGGVYQIIFGIIEGVQHGWNIIMNGIEADVNWFLGICEYVANGAIGIANDIRSGIIGIVTDLVEWIADLVDNLNGTEIGDMLGINSAADSIHQITQDLKSAQQNGFKKISLKRVNMDEHKVDPIDSVQITADAIDGAISKVHDMFNRSIDAQTKSSKSANKSLDNINNGIGQLVDMGQREEDLRWMKEMAEQRFINEVNLRQLTPTINLQVKGASNQTPNDYAKSLAFELQKMADAGTFNAYGNVG